MAAVTLEIDYTSPRSRLTTLFRYLLAIPHLVVAGALLYAAQVVAVVQWVIILFTGKRNRGIFDFTNGVLNWATRAYTYAGLMYDTYPAFGFQAGNEPVRYGLEYDEPASRLTNGLRFIWAIPAAIVGILLSLVGSLLTVVCWFVIIITANQPQGLFDFLLRTHRYMADLNAYTLLLTDTYPKFR